ATIIVALVTPKSEGSPARKARHGLGTRWFSSCSTILENSFRKPFTSAHTDFSNIGKETGGSKPARLPHDCEEISQRPPPVGSGNSVRYVVRGVCTPSVAVRQKHYIARKRSKSRPTSRTSLHRRHPRNRTRFWCVDAFATAEVLFRYLIEAGQ